MVDAPGEPAYILCGGRSSRFGSDKARALLHGEALIQRLVRLATEEGLGPILGVAQSPDAYADLGVACVTDLRADRQGPLAGLEAALTHRLGCQGPGTLVLLSCDLLALRSDWMASLRAPSCGGTSASATAFRDAEGFWHPLPGRYHTDLLPGLHAALDGGTRSFQHFLLSVPVNPLPLPPGGFPQANTPTELDTSS